MNDAVRQSRHSFERLGEDAMSVVLRCLGCEDLTRASRVDRRLYQLAQRSAAEPVVAMPSLRRVTRGGPSFQPDTPLVRLNLKEDFLVKVHSEFEVLFQKNDGDDEFRCDASVRESSLQTCRSLFHVNWELMVASGRMADIWRICDERDPFSGAPPPLVESALDLLSELANVAHWSRREMHGAYFGALGLLNPENHARLVVLLRLSFETDYFLDQRFSVCRLLQSATRYPPVAALAFGAFAQHMDLLVRTLELEDYQMATVVGNLARGPQHDRAEALTRAGCLQLLIDHFESGEDPEDQTIFACPLTFFSVRAADCRPIREVFLRRQNVERLVAIAETCQNDADAADATCYPDKRHWRRCARDVYLSVLSEVRLAARLQPEGHSDVIGMLAHLLDTAEAAACVARFLAWRERRRWHDGMRMNFDTSVMRMDDYDTSV